MIHSFTRSLSCLLCLFSIAMLSTIGCSMRPSTGPDVVDADAPTEFTTTESGLQYRVLRRGNGKFPNVNSSVKVDYRGWLDNNTTFDTSYKMRKSPVFKLSGVVAGFTEGLQLVSEGGMIELIMPPELGYGDQRNGIIPPGSTLNFRVELLEIK